MAWQNDDPMRVACREAREWAAAYPTLHAAWSACERGDWMLWYLGKTVAGEPWSDARRPLVWAACQCARLAPRPYLPTIVMLEQWAMGANDQRPSREQVHAAAASADAAAAAAYYADAADAAYAAAYAAAADAAYAAARRRVLRQCADIVRSLWPDPTRPAEFVWDGRGL